MRRTVGKCAARYQAVSLGNAARFPPSMLTPGTARDSKFAVRSALWGSEAARTTGNREDACELPSALSEIPSLHRLPRYETLHLELKISKAVGEGLETEGPRRSTRVSMRSSALVISAARPVLLSACLGHHLALRTVND